ncbi:unnamed protein product [Owenia fusiformis]|uniref:Uncharacterized protein n=1 Tax=Owenia fusiformis TaxID=6347 RepID=A0A8J1Y961_OWEFU|nr:unnamed protein product [Owenia fusiformis]
MSKNGKVAIPAGSDVIEIKSKFDAEFRRFSIDRKKHTKCDDFLKLVEGLHNISHIPFTVAYTDVRDGDLLPINNDNNYEKALSIAKPILKIHVQKKGDYVDLNNVILRKKPRPLTKLFSGDQPLKPHFNISLPEDFRRVSAIIDVDLIPETHRRVKLMKNGTDKPLGFYIRDGTSVRVTPEGLEKVPGIFISRLVPGGLAESTGLLAVNDEVLEVNGIEVNGKTLDQVTDMMVANSSNLIITVKPVNQRNQPHRGGVGRTSNTSLSSYQSARSGKSMDSDEVKAYHTTNEGEEEEDEVKDLIKTGEGSTNTSPPPSSKSPSSQSSPSLNSPTKSETSDVVIVTSSSPNNTVVKTTETTVTTTTTKNTDNDTKIITKTEIIKSDKNDNVEVEDKKALIALETPEVKEDKELVTL